MTSPLGRSTVHESAVRHVTGEARYVDDLPEPRDMLHGLPVGSPYAHARILQRDRSAALAVPGVRAVVFFNDLPGDNTIGAITHDEPLLAEDRVHCRGQLVALVVGDSKDACLAGERALEIDYEPLAPILGIQQAIAQHSYLGEPHVIARGDVEQVLTEAPVHIEAQCSNGAQDHFYLEPQASLAIPGEHDTMHVYTSSQHPTECQRMVAHVLGLGHHKVVCEVPRMGGGFGGKESQATHFACLAALGAHATGRPVKVVLDRDQDMTMTGKRHPFWSTYRAGFDEQGHLLALDVHAYSDAGWVSDLSGPILDRCLFHLDNAYFVPTLRFEGRMCRTNVLSNTAFRGFGGPQGVLVVEDALTRCAERLGIDQAEIRRRNYYGAAPRNLTPYGQEVPESRSARMHDILLRTADYVPRIQALREHNRLNPWIKRGLALQPVKFGISFTASLLNQAGALVLVYADGTVQLNHGGTEMGQGLHTKMLTVCAHELGVKTSQIRMMHTATDKVPNTSATAASSGSDLNGQAVAQACEQIRERMRAVAADLLDSAPEAVVFANGEVRAGERTLSFAKVANTCWVRQVSLSATGFYSTPNIWYDRVAGRGHPFHYFAYGVALVEVEVNGLTGEHRIRRADILHDVGDSLVPSIDVGQVEGAFVQGAGWLTCEEVIYDGTGRLLTVGPSTYKIPAAGDVPEDFRVALLKDATQDATIHGSKAVGEPPFMLGIAVVTALRQAIASFGGPRQEIELAVPATPEAILRAIDETRQAAADQRLTGIA